MVKLQPSQALRLSKSLMLSDRHLIVADIAGYDVHVILSNFHVRTFFFSFGSVWFLLYSPFLPARPVVVVR